MRSVLFLAAATAASLATRGDAKKKNQVVLDPSQDSPTDANAVQTWWDALPNPDNLLSSIEECITKNTRGSKLDNILASIDSDSENEAEESRFHWPHHGHGHRHRHEDKTIYELIKDSKHASKFAKLVEEHDEIKQLLDDKEHAYTLFVPTDRALDRIHRGHHGRHGHDDDNGNGDENDEEGGNGDDDGDRGQQHQHQETTTKKKKKKKPSKEFILAFLKYHIVPGLYPAERIQKIRTLPTELHPAALDGASTHHYHHHHHEHHGDDDNNNNNNNNNHHPQRIRAFTVPIIHFTHLNFRTRPIGPELHAKNGIVRAIDFPLIPPPSQTALVGLLPGQFSTLALALETTGLGEELGRQGQPRSGGGTLFAPTNRAWAALGPRLNAFLFSDAGRKYLRALVRYHAVVNETLYSDAYYRGGDDDHDGDDGDGDGDDGKDNVAETAARVGRAGRGYVHVDLPSLLHGTPISVDIRSWKGFVSIVVNGFVKVDVRDVVADDGVVHVIGRVLIPPHKPRGAAPPEKEEGEGEEGEMSVEELKARLDPYLETEEEPTGGQDNIGDL
ncbi:hypothetical protein VTH82DRAFT_7488 [Thermothelomyces myriococcoides]